MPLIPSVLVQAALLLLAVTCRPTLAGFGDWFKHAPDSTSEMIEEFDQLNSELVKWVKSEAALDNILEALEWLKMASGERPVKPQLDLPSKEALIRFTSLINLMDPDKPYCDLTSYNILHDNELATGTDISVEPDELSAQRRIESVVYEVAHQHARQCRYEYPRQFAEARADKPKKRMRELQSMMNAMIETSKRLVFMPKERVLDPRHVLARKAKGVSVAGQPEAVALLMNLRHRARHDPDSRFLTVLPDPRKRGHWIVNEGKVVELMDRFVYSRCEFMFSAFGHIFQPAQFEQEFFAKNNKYRATSEPNAEFMLWLEYYQLCRNAVAQKRELDNNVIKAIWSELKG